MASRHSKWHPPPPPSPRILHLPRRFRRPKAAKASSAREWSELRRERRGKLESLFDQERLFSHSAPIVLLSSDEAERRDRVEESRRSGGGDDDGDEKWRFQAEILRAECNFLRMEREIALKKLECSRSEMEHALQSAMETLISGREKIYEGQQLGDFLEKEIEYLEGKLEELQRSSGSRDFELKNCGNFDRQASVLRRRLEKIDGASEEEKQCVREIQVMAEESLKIKSFCRYKKNVVSDQKTRFPEAEMLRRKMEVLSRGMLERMEEYGSTVLSTGSGCSSAANSKRIEFPEIEKRQQEVCCSRCKAIVNKIIEQARAETEQWSQMQGMLGQVRDEMEELQASRDFWEDRALESDDRLHTLQSQTNAWKQKAQSSENKVSELQKQIIELQLELERSKEPMIKPPSDILNADVTKTRRGYQRVTEDHKEKEKRVLICRLKENSQNNKKVTERDEKRRGHMCAGSIPKRSPLIDIGNSSPIFGQSKTVFPLYSPQQASKSGKLYN